MELPAHPLMPERKPIDYSLLSTRASIDLVEFKQSFYTRAFRDPSKRPSDLEPLALRLCAFIDLKNEDKMSKIPFSQPFASRFVSVLFTDVHDHTHLYEENNSMEESKPKDPRNVDVQTIYFSGHEIPSLYNLQLPEGRPSH